MSLAEAWDGLVAALGGESGFWILLTIYLSMILGERVLYAFQNRIAYEGKDALASMGVSTLNAVLSAALGALVPIGLYVLVYENGRLTEIPLAWWSWIAIFLWNDLAYYLDHRIGHRVGFFWAFHHAHHSSQELNFTTASRGCIFDNMPRTAMMLGAAFLGFDPAQVVAMEILKNVWGIFNHTRLVDKMGWLEGIMATPSHHRVHHGTNPDYLDKNYGQVLIVWDRMFGTFAPEREPPKFGLVKNIRTRNPVLIPWMGVAELWRKIAAAPRLGDKLGYLVHPPGWSHDGAHETAEVLRARAAGLGAQ